jgi:hypothetical protein
VGEKDKKSGNLNTYTIEGTGYFLQCLIGIQVAYAVPVDSKSIGDFLGRLANAWGEWGPSLSHRMSCLTRSQVSLGSFELKDYVEAA